MIGISDVGQPSVLLGISVGVAIWLLIQRQRSEATTLAVAAFGAGGLNYLVGTINWVGSARPEQREQIKIWVRIVARFAKAADMPIVLTSSLEDQAQDPLLPAFADIARAPFQILCHNFC
ncbi:MAG: hypothetical protein NVS2B14_11630 [Chamaesiphon sp.]